MLEITPTDVTTGNEYSETLVQTRISTGEGDALFAANVDLGVETEYSRPDGTTFHPTYLEQFLYNYFNTAEDLGEGGYFDDMAAYLNTYYYGDYTKGEADEQKIESDFLARIKKLNDKRFKTSQEKREGFQQEKSAWKNSAPRSFPSLATSTRDMWNCRKQRCIFRTRTAIRWKRRATTASTSVPTNNGCPI